MGFDLNVIFSNTCITPKDPNYTENISDIKGGCYIQVNNALDTAIRLVSDAPVRAQDNNDSVFTWDTGIWKYDDFMHLDELKFPGISRIQQEIREELIKQSEIVKYLFIGLF